ncbi:MAG TPA: thioredoxin-like domain-containing protein [Gemmataceae bacterium]|nr:thioredoxin-like domain-containing protein [Gemmataceae bacterium]
MYPHERSLVQRLEGKPFALLGINSDDDLKKVEKVIVKEKMVWRNWWDGGSTDGPIQTAYNVQHWPTLLVLDHKGVIRFIDVNGKELDGAIDKLLTEQETANKH